MFKRVIKRNSSLIVGLFAFYLLALVAHAAHAATGKRVEESLEKATAYLYTLPKNGIWDESATAPAPGAAAKAPQAAGQWTGPTALAVYALLAAGEN